MIHQRLLTQHKGQPPPLRLTPTAEVPAGSQKPPSKFKQCLCARTHTPTHTPHSLCRPNSEQLQGDAGLTLLLSSTLLCQRRKRPGGIYLSRAGSLCLAPRTAGRLLLGQLCHSALTGNTSSAFWGVSPQNSLREKSEASSSSLRLPPRATARGLPLTF